MHPADHPACRENTDKRYKNTTCLFSFILSQLWGHILHKRLHFYFSPSSPQSAVVCNLIRKEPTSANPPLQCQKTGRENMSGCSFFFPVQSNNTFMHYTRSKKWAGVFKMAVLYLSGGHRRKITGHELTEMREPSFTAVCSSFSREVSSFRILSSIRKPWDRKKGNF